MPLSTSPAALTDLDALRAQNEALQQHVARLALVQQELIATRDRLDRELARFGHIHRFNTQAIGVRDAARFAEVTAEAVVDIFELEFGLFWPLAEDGTPAGAPAVAIGIDPDALSAADLAALLPTGPAEAALWHGDECPALAAAGIAQLALGRCAGAAQQPLAWVLGGVLASGADFYAGLAREHLESFTVFAQQVGALLQNRADQATIEQQIEQLRLEQERLDLALEGSNAGHWDWDLRSGTVYLSERWKAQLGFGPHEIGDGQAGWESLTHPEDLPASRARVADYLSGRSLVYENLHRLRHRDGHYVWILARGRALRDAAGRPYRMVGTHVDVSDQKSIAEKFQAIFQHSTDGYVLLDARNTVVDCNPVSASLLGCAPETLLGGDLFAHSPTTQPDDRRSASAARALVEQARTAGVARAEWLFTGADGALLPAEVTLARIVLDERTLVFANIHDLTERKLTEATLRRAEEEQRRARELAEAASRAKSAFLATMSHEIRTPMHGVLGMLQLLEDAGPTPQQRRYLGLAQQSARSLLTLIDDILDLSRVEAGRLTLESVAFDPAALVSEVVQLLRVQAQAKGLSLDLLLSGALPGAVLGDPGRFKQILNNLLGNAIKFTDRGEVIVTLAARGLPGAPARTALVLGVQDTGIGFDPATSAALFDPFTQADASTTRRFGGSGLGLSICRRLVDLMGGQIEVQSAPGHGALFRVELPCRVASTGTGTGTDTGTDTGTGTCQGDTGANERPLTRAEPAAGEAWFPGSVPDLTLVVGPSSDPVAGSDPRAYQALPPADVSAPMPDPAPAPVSGPAPGPAPGPVATAPFDGAHALIVDDNLVNQTVARAMLARLGLRVATAENGEEALALLTESGADPFDIVLMDVQMPVMDGYEATRRLRVRERALGTRRLPVVALTANAMPEHRAEGLAAGMDDYLTKPLERDLLTATLRRWLGDGGPTDDGAPAGTATSAPATAAIIPTRPDRIPP